MYVMHDLQLYPAYPSAMAALLCQSPPCLLGVGTLDLKDSLSTSPDVSLTECRGRHGFRRGEKEGLSEEAQ